MQIRAVVFDAYGTLFDVHSVAACADRFFPGQGAALSRLWRERQIDYSRLRTISNRYQPFSVVTADALGYALERLGLTDRSGEAGTALLNAYRELDLFAENTTVLRRLGEAGIPLAVLSNGNEEMLHAVLSHAKIASHFVHVLSADHVKRFKTAPETYALAEEAFGCPATQMLFVSSNCWDVCGAAWYGYRTFWVNRQNEPMERLDVEPNATASSMAPLVDFVIAPQGRTVS